FQLERALMLNPNDTIMMVWMAWLVTYRGRPQEALEWVDKAFRLNPYPPSWFECVRGMALYSLGRYSEALGSFRRSADPFTWELMYLVACYGQLGHIKEARTAVARFRFQYPGKSLLQFAAVEPYELTADHDRLVEGLRKAGLPE